MDKHVFISYKHEDSEFAENLINRVKNAGFRTWVDNDELAAGEDWRSSIDESIRNAFALIVIMTPEAKASEYVTYEWAFAWGAGVKVIPVLYKSTQLHPRLEALQYLDFTSRTNRPWDALLNVLKRAMPIASLDVPLTNQDHPSLPQKMQDTRKTSNKSYHPVLFQLDLPGGGLATAKIVDDNFIVLAGSQAKKNATPSLQQYYLDAREKLRSEQKLVEDKQNDLLLFIEDTPFSSPSAAASVITGSSANGHLVWKVKGTKQRYGEWTSK